MAAKLAVGCGGDAKRRKLNLTQLRRKKRKQADKTSGRKRPRLHDIDVVPADDAEPEVTATLTAAIATASNNDQPDVEPDVEPDTPTPDGEIHYDGPPVSGQNMPNHGSSTIAAGSGNADDSVCGACEQSCPPAAKQKKSRVIRWTDCDECHRWFHNVCVHLGRRTPAHFVCAGCE